MQIKKIVIIGPESTGKSTLCSLLASHYNTRWVPEYAREYLLKNGTTYSIKDLFTIAEGQIKTEDNIITNFLKPQTLDNKSTPVFIDTDLNVIRVWSEFVFNKCDNRILTSIAVRKYDHYLLCNTDMPWVKDELREYPDYKTREKLFHYYKETLQNQPAPWTMIEGEYENRLQLAIKAVNRLLQ